MELPSADRASKDKERVHVLETAVVTWTRQIKNVLKLDPEQARAVMACRSGAANRDSKLCERSCKDSDHLSFRCIPTALEPCAPSCG